MFVVDGFGSGLIPPTSGIVGLAMLAFIAGRMVLLRRRGCGPQSACLLHTVRQSGVLLAKVLVIFYFVTLLGQLPFRAIETKRLEAAIHNEVRAMMGMD